MPAPPLVGSARVNGNKENLVKILLHGMTGPVDGKEYSDVMAPMGHNDDDYIAAVLTYILNDFADNRATVRSSLVEKVRKETEGRKEYWTLKELSEINQGL